MSMEQPIDKMWEAWKRGRFVAIESDSHHTDKHEAIDRAIQETLFLFANAPKPYQGGSWIYDLRAYCKATAKRFNALTDLMRMLYSGKPDA